MYVVYLCGSVVGFAGMFSTRTSFGRSSLSDKCAQQDIGTISAAASCFGVKYPFSLPMNAFQLNEIIKATAVETSLDDTNKKCFLPFITIDSERKIPTFQLCVFFFLT